MLKKLLEPDILPAPTFEVFPTFYYREGERLTVDRARYNSINTQTEFQVIDS